MGAHRVVERASAPVQVTQFRSDPLYPQMVAGVAWIDTHRASVVLYPGRLEPSVSLPRGPMEVPPSSRSRLLATFNSGFKLQDSHGGYALGGVTSAPLQNGLGTVIGYSDGRIDIQDWQYGPKAPAGVQFARQNLPLIVSGGQPNPNLSDGPEWGATLGNAVRVWRSGIGVDARGDLIYAAASDQTVGSLAQILIRAGAIRAMQLDINSYWVTFNSYAGPNAGQPSSLLPSMTHPRRVTCRPMIATSSASPALSGRPAASATFATRRNASSRNRSCCPTLSPAGFRGTLDPKLGIATGQVWRARAGRALRARPARGTVLVRDLERRNLIYVCRPEPAGLGLCHRL